jgi:hypothetical protein
MRLHRVRQVEDKILKPGRIYEIRVQALINDQKHPPIVDEYELEECFILYDLIGHVLSSIKSVVPSSCISLLYRRTEKRKISPLEPDGAQEKRGPSGRRDNTHD